MASRLYDYHIWDARKISEKIKKPIVDVTITSPPYWNLKNYGSENQVGYKQSYGEYLEDLKGIFSYISKITKKTGSLWVIIDTFKKGGKTRLLPFDLARDIEPWWDLQDIIIWYKDKTLPWSHKGKFRNIFEYILFFTKKGSSDFKYYIDRIKDPEDLKEWWVRYPERYNPKGKTPTKVWWYEPIPTQGSWGNGYVRHFCPFPPKLIENILLLTTDEGDVVLDPMAGSGSVLAQAKVMGRKSIGFDLNEDYKKMYEEKVLPQFKTLWKTRKKELEERDKKRAELEENIKKLRLLKYPKELVKRSAQNGFFEEIGSTLDTIFVLNNGNDWSNPDIYFIFTNKVDKEKILLKFNEICTKPPLSRYGVNPTLKIYDKKTFLRTKNQVKINETLFLYSSGQTHNFHKEITLPEWGRSIEEVIEKTNIRETPPIISNMGVSLGSPYKRSL